MAIKNKAEIIFEDNWEQIKKEIRSHWRKFKEEDIENITNYKEFSTKLQELYDLSEEELQSKIEIFIDKLGLVSFVNRLEELKNAFYQSSLQTKNSIKKSINQIQQQSATLSAKIVEYVKENPLQAVGFSVLLVALARMMCKKNSKN